MTDTEWFLVGAAKKGDAHSFALLYERYYKDLYRFAVCLLGDSYAAEDAVSAAVLSAYERLPLLKKDSSFKSWLFQITVNECRAWLRDQSRGTYLADADWQEPAAEEAGYERPEVEEYLSLLSEEERLVVTLSVFGGYNSREIGGLINKKEGSVRSIKSRAFARVRECLGLEDGI